VGSPDAGHKLGCNHLGAPEPDTLGTLDGQGVAGALADDPPLPLGGGCHASS
jgi:hypothetical protein